MPEIKQGDYVLNKVYILKVLSTEIAIQHIDRVIRTCDYLTNHDLMVPPSGYKRRGHKSYEKKNPWEG